MNDHARAPLLLLFKYILSMSDLIMALSIFIRQNTGIFFEYMRKVALRRKNEIVADSRYGLDGITKQTLCLVVFSQYKIICVLRHT